MILAYKEYIEKFGNDYQLERAVAEENIYRIEPGVYSTSIAFRFGEYKSMQIFSRRVR